MASYISRTNCSLPCIEATVRRAAEASADRRCTASGTTHAVRRDLRFESACLIGAVVRCAWRTRVGAEAGAADSRVSSRLPDDRAGAGERRATLGGCGSHPSSSTGGSPSTSSQPRRSSSIWPRHRTAVDMGRADVAARAERARGTRRRRRVVRAGRRLAGAAPGDRRNDRRLPGGGGRCHRRFKALWLLLLVAAEPGANVVLPHPGYPAFDELARHLALEVRHYHLAAAAQHNIDVDELAARLDDRTAVVIVNTPHNPTGSVVGAELWRSCAKWWQTTAPPSSSSTSTTPTTTARRHHRRRRSPRRQPSATCPRRCAWPAYAPAGSSNMTAAATSSTSTPGPT